MASRACFICQAAALGMCQSEEGEIHFQTPTEPSPKPAAVFARPQSESVGILEIQMADQKREKTDGGGIWSACGKLLDRITETESRNDLRHCGYRYS